MEANLIAAYKSLALVKADPQLPQPWIETVDGMMGTIKGALLGLAHKRAESELDAVLK